MDSQFWLEGVLANLGGFGAVAVRAVRGERGGGGSTMWAQREGSDVIETVLCGAAIC